MKTLLKKVCCIATFTLLALPVVSQQGILYGIRQDYNTNENFLIQINETTGAVTQVSTSGFGKGTIYNVATIDPVYKRFFFITPGDTLFSIDLATGNILSKVVLSTKGLYYAPAMEYDPSSNQIYGASQHKTSNIMYLSKINPATGSVSILSVTGFSASSATMYGVNYLLSTTLDPVQKRFYITSEYYGDTLYTFSLNNGVLSSKVKLTSSFTFTGAAYYRPTLEFNCNDNTLYAMVMNNMNSMQYLSKVNATTGSVTVISASGVSNNIMLGSTAFNPVNNLFYMIDGMSSALVSVNCATGNQNSQTGFSNNSFYSPVLGYDQTCAIYYNFVGIREEKNMLSGVEVFPNPGHDHVTIVCSEDSELNLVDSRGAIVYKRELSSGQTTINASQFVAGLYFYTVKNKGSVSSGKLIIE